MGILYILRLFLSDRQSARRGHDLVHFIYTARAGLSAPFTPTQR